MLSCPVTSNKLRVKKQVGAIFTTTILVIIISIFIGNLALKAYAKDECKDISNVQKQRECYEKKEAETQRKLSETRSKIEDTLNSISQLSSQLNVTQSQLNQIQNNINETEEELKLINETLEDRNQKLSEKIDFRNNLLRNYAKKNILSDLELLFTQSDNNLTGFQISSLIYAFNKAASEETLDIISTLNSEIRQFEKNKEESEALKNELESARNNLASLRNSLASKKTLEEDEYEELEEKEEGYEKELEELQSKILSLKYSEEGGTVGDYETPSTKTPDPSFSSRPAFAAFSHGAYTHYNGMSQYGAYGRAKEGQNYEKILKFYYKVGLDEKGDDWDKKTKIKVKYSDGSVQEMTYRYYLYGIAEMPSDWPKEALKAQAIAARTYAYRSNKPICTTQSCQVFNKSKAEAVESGKYKDWKEAVDKTSGQLLDNPSTSQYSSTTGGYLNQAGWDAKDGLEGWKNGKAYEVPSPWFYKAWYTKSYSSNDNCGRSSPWLKEEEMVDILNAWVVYRKGTSSEKSHITPTTKSCWGGDPYSLDKMAEKADKYGEKYTSVSSAKVEISSSGYTSKVIFQTNRGSVPVDGQTFKTVFNLRAPGYIAIRSRLFNIEIKN